MDREETTPLPPPHETALIQKVQFLLSQKPHALILEDHSKGVLTARVIRALIEAAKTEGVPILVDPKRENFWVYEGLRSSNPTSGELSDALGRKLRPELPILEEAVRELRRRMPHTYTVVTLSEGARWSPTKRKTLPIFPPISGRL